MKQQIATFIAAQPSPPVWKVQFEVAHSPSPGMYVLADLGEAVRTPLFPSEIRDTGFAAIVPPGHPATALLPGARVDFLGPLGNGFDIQADRLLLIADVEHYPTLMPLQQSAAAVSLIIEAVSRLQLPSPRTIPTNVELILVTLDGSIGYVGPLESTDPPPSGYARAQSALIELISWADQVCLALDSVRYGELANIIYTTRLNPRDNYAQCLVQTAMPCGVGVCDICRITTNDGEKHVCTDGPVFDLSLFRSNRI